MSENIVHQSELRIFAATETFNQSGSNSGVVVTYNFILVEKFCR